MTDGKAPPGVEGKWEKAARERNCYCGLWDKNPALYEKEGLPLGFCGKCERCGVPGHTRHFPGPVPYTGSWCDRCYRIVGWTWPLRSVGGWLRVFAVATSIWVVVRALVI